MKVKVLMANVHQEMPSIPLPSHNAVSFSPFSLAYQLASSIFILRNMIVSEINILKDSKVYVRGFVSEIESYPALIYIHRRTYIYIISII